MPAHGTLRSLTPLSRRRVIRLGGLAVAAGFALRAGVVRAERVAWPAAPDAPRATYIGKTGHYLRGPFLAWWLEQDGERTLGWPVTEVNRVDGTPVQYFERGALARLRAGDDSQAVEPLDIGSSWAAQIDPVAVSTAEGDRRSEYWFWRSGRGVHPTFWRTFVDNGGAFAFGYPISNAVIRDGRLTQWFTRARMRETPDGIRLDPLGFWETTRVRVPTGRVPLSGGIKLFRRSSYRQDLGEPGRRWVEVDVPRQTVTFLAGERVLRQVLVSTGRVPGWTPDGDWRIFLRKRDERMRGEDPEDPDYYDLSNVYFTQYFTRQWHALHYAWWHDEFGTVQSQGCVNMRYADAEWAWRFCGDGTHVIIHNAPGLALAPPTQPGGP